jgi:hypothetical protein
MRAEFREDCDMLWETPLRDPRMTHKEVLAWQVLQIRQEIWAELILRIPRDVLAPCSSTID